ncbi:FAD-dependent oxidoreductase [Daejeonella lutea]|uniref:FAD dependent oxidoreductase n=1 Tax=Daejeonella lutea TaxID=572036 RepID=A0A1T5DT77_9SPHI|nr:FAD-dependent oxidoreductase [Daejeonella lutea]SKB74871.1 FAD dependent oxidoreductase [Daejeonella lutea]
MFKYFFSIMILAVLSHTLPAQTIKTGVLVIGNTAPGFAASIQSARSGAKTAFLTQSSAISPELTSEDLLYLEKVHNHYQGKNKKKPGAKDSVAAFDLNMKKDQYGKMIKGISDTTKNLTVILNSPLEKIEKDGKGWEIRLKNGQKIKTDVVVDATENLFIASILRIDANKTMLNPVADPFNTKLYRSTVATAYTGTANSKTILPVSMGAFLPAGVENFIIIPKSTAGFRPVNMSVGQAAGTIASYCAFFKTTTKNINVRAVQTELLTFDAHLIPLSDIQPDDPNFQAFQRMALSGLLKPAITKVGEHNVIKFDTAGTFSSEQLRAPMREFYSRSQLWFADNKKDVMTIEDAISLFMFTATRGNELSKEIEEGWKESFKFESKFDLKRPITRKEFAILADQYLLPFKTRVDFAGNLLS